VTAADTARFTTQEEDMNNLTAPLAAQLHSRYLDLQTRVEERSDALEGRTDEGATTLEYAGGTLAAMTLVAILIGLFKTGFVPKFIEGFLKKMLEKHLTV
jgi:hypothetical protein